MTSKMSPSRLPHLRGGIHSGLTSPTNHLRTPSPSYKHNKSLASSGKHGSMAGGRRKRANSIEKDIADLSNMREAMNVEREQVLDLLREELQERNRLETGRDHALQNFRKDFLEKRKHVDYHDELRYRMKAQEALMSRIGTLLQQSKEQDKLLKKQREEERKEEKVQQIQKYRKKVEAHKNKKVKATQEQWRERRIEIVTEKLDRKQRIRKARDELVVARSQSALEERELATDHKYQRIAEEALLRHKKRKHVIAERNASLSPTLFLKLPSMVETLKDHENTDLERVLREDRRMTTMLKQNQSKSLRGASVASPQPGAAASPPHRLAPLDHNTSGSPTRVFNRKSIVGSPTFHGRRSLFAKSAMNTSAALDDVEAHSMAIGCDEDDFDAALEEHYDD